MKTYRIGNDIVMRWHIRTREGEVPLAEQDLRIDMVNGVGDVLHPSFEVVDDTLLFTFRGVEQNVLGAYSLALYINAGKDAQRVIDVCDAFRLVDACYEGACVCGCQQELEMTSDLQFCGIGVSEMWALLGRDGEEQINKSHIEGALSDYLFSEFVAEI